MAGNLVPDFRQSRIVRLKRHITRSSEFVALDIERGAEGRIVSSEAIAGRVMVDFSGVSIVVPTDHLEVIG